MVATVALCIVAVGVFAAPVVLLSVVTVVPVVSLVASEY